LKDGTSFSFQYETGYASMPPIYYELFWRVKYPALHNLTLLVFVAKLKACPIGSSSDIDRCTQRSLPTSQMGLMSPMAF
jgi:hypothetical protein